MRQAKLHKWFTARELAELFAGMDIPGLPHTERGVSLLLKREGHPQLRRRRVVRSDERKGNAGLEYNIDLFEHFVRLPLASDAALMAEVGRRTAGAKIVIRVPAPTRRV